jgi:UDPglucose 6-dehydrogenase
MRICVTGAGYVGLTTAACFAELGNEVVCVDIDEEKILQLQEGNVPIFEPGLQELVQRNLKEGRLFFTTDLKEAVRNSKVIFIAVGTPSLEDGSVDLSAVKEVAKGIGRYMNEHKIIVNKSTMPVGSGDMVASIIAENQEEKVTFDVVSNPEFLREGSAISDFMNPDRIILGTSNHAAASVLLELYEPMDTQVMIVDQRSAEMIKYASNAFLATKISFINEIANICDRVGANVTEVADGMGWDRRIAHAFLRPGVGYGGSCFPKDCEALLKISEENGYEFKILKAAQLVNELQPHIFVQKVKEALGELEGRRLAVFGLSFKPNTDDMRGAPSITIINLLLKEGAIIVAYDPAAMKRARQVFGDKILYAKNVFEAAEGADAVCVLTEWPEFKHVDLERLRELLKNPIIIDGRNVYEPKKAKSAGFIYRGMGRR